MFRDAKEELKRLEAELLAAEREESEQARADRLLEEFLAEDDGAFEEDEDILAVYPESIAPRGNTGYRNYSNNYGRSQPAPAVYNSDRSDEDLEEYAEEIYEEPKDDLRGLTLLAMALLAGILGMLAFWAVRYL